MADTRSFDINVLTVKGVELNSFCKWCIMSAITAKINLLYSRFMNSFYRVRKSPHAITTKQFLRRFMSELSDADTSQKTSFVIMRCKGLKKLNYSQQTL